MGARRSTITRRSIIATAVLGAALIGAFTGARATDPRANVARGKQLYLATGCYQCHGTRGEGGGYAGPRLAPPPIPFAALVLQLRQPRARMPVYTDVVMPDRDVADIYAYLQSIPKGKTAAEIPMLSGSSPGQRSQ
jgi:mono/diheme cytochrome c family protein